jgi:hypothetical protein
MLGLATFLEGSANHGQNTQDTHDNERETAFLAG